MATAAHDPRRPVRNRIRAPRRLLAAVRSVYGRGEAKLVEHVDRRILLGAGTALFGVGLARAVGPMPNEVYATIAQVLPVFLLVGIVEGRYFTGLERRRPFDRFFLGGLLTLALAGEAAAIATLALDGDMLVVRAILLLGCQSALLLFWAYATLGPARGGQQHILRLAEEVQRAVEQQDAVRAKERRPPPRRR